jgi:hypothetical protein
MCRRSTLLVAAALAFAGSALAAPVTPFAPDPASRRAGWAVQSGNSGLILVQRGGGGARAGGGARGYAGTANRGGGFNIPRTSVPCGIGCEFNLRGRNAGECCCGVRWLSGRQPRRAQGSD